MAQGRDHGAAGINNVKKFLIEGKQNTLNAITTQFHNVKACCDFLSYEVEGYPNIITIHK